MTYEEMEELNRLEEIRYEKVEKWLRSHNKREENTEGYIYLIKCADKYKIGYSKDVDRRFKEIDTRPFPCELITSVDSPIAFPVEQKMHELLIERRVAGEWYSFKSDISADKFNNIIYYVEEQMLKWG